MCLTVSVSVIPHVSHSVCLSVCGSICQTVSNKCVCNCRCVSHLLSFNRSLILSVSESVCQTTRCVCDYRSVTVGLTVTGFCATRTHACMPGFAPKGVIVWKICVSMCACVHVSLSVGDMCVH